MLVHYDNVRTLYTYAFFYSSPFPILIPYFLREPSEVVVAANLNWQQSNLAKSTQNLNRF